MNRITGPRQRAALFWLLIAAWVRAATAQAAPLPLPSLWVNQQWLANHTDNTNLVVIDARSRDDYDIGHLPGAISLPVSETFGNEPRPDLVAPIDKAQHLFQQAGIDHNVSVVIYDDGELIDAARIFWALEIYGHRSVAILDGGFKSWTKAGLPETQIVTTPRAVQFVPTINPDRLSTKLKVRLAMEKDDSVLIDVRSEKEYRGESSIVERAGHIPGAHNVPWTDNFHMDDSSKRLKSLNELEARYADLTRGKRKVIAYCNKGKQSALTYLVLRGLGHDVAAYDGSWFEWGADQSLPVTNPAKD